MIVIAGAILGAGWGTYLARKRGGKGPDQLLYAAGFGIAFTLVGVYLTIFIERMAS